MYGVGNRVAAALMGAWGENLGYYSLLTVREIYNHRKEHHAKGKNYGFKGFFRTLFHLLLEFGTAECFDSFLFRPLFMYIFPLILNNFVLGIIVGKFAADVTFYIPAIISYELKKKHLKVVK